MVKEISSRTERFGAVAGSLSRDTKCGIHFWVLFWYLKSPQGGEPKMDVQALFYKAKDFRSHYSRYDLLTPQPLKRADFFWFNDSEASLDAQKRGR